jgi:hypothetical protein
MIFYDFDIMYVIIKHHNIAYYDVLGGVMQPTQLQVDKVVAFCIMFFYGFFGAVEMKFKHILFGVLVLELYIAFVIVLAQVDYFVYAPLEKLDVPFVFGGLLGYPAMYILFSVVYLVMHRLKLKMFKVELYDYMFQPVEQKPNNETTTTTTTTTNNEQQQQQQLTFKTIERSLDA